MKHTTTLIATFMLAILLSGFVSLGSNFNPPIRMGSEVNYGSGSLGISGGRNIPTRMGSGIDASGSLNIRGGNSIPTRIGNGLDFGSSIGIGGGRNIQFYI